MQQALQLAHQAAQLQEVPVGAVIVDGQGQLIAQGYNQTICRTDPTAHAEIVALRAAAQTLQNYRLPGLSLFVTLEPCAMCMGALLHARLQRVVFATSDPKTGVCGSVLDLPSYPQLNHHTKIEHGLYADEAAQLLKDFFKARREAAKQQRLAQIIDTPLT